MFPRLFTIDGVLTLHTYGLLVALGLLVGLYTAGRLAARAGLDKETVWNLGVYMALVALVGAKLAVVVTEWGYYSAHPREIFSWTTLQAGGIFYGGLAFAFILAVGYAWRYRLDFHALADAYAPGLALGHAVGRLGCFSAGCCWGKPASVALAVTFTDPYSARLVGVPLGIPLHPTQLYEALAEGVIFALLLALWRRWRYPGEIFAAYLFLYALARFAIEFYRGDPRGGFFFGGALSLPQVVSVALFVVAELYGFTQRRRAAARHAR